MGWISREEDVGGRRLRVTLVLVILEPSEKTAKSSSQLTRRRESSASNSFWFMFGVGIGHGYGRVVGDLGWSVLDGKAWVQYWRQISASYKLRLPQL